MYMDLEVTGAFIYFTIPIFGGINVTQTMVSQAIVTALLCWAFIYCRLHGPASHSSRRDLLEAGSLPIQVTRELLDAEK